MADSRHQGCFFSPSTYLFLTPVLAGKQAKQRRGKQRERERKAKSVSFQLPERMIFYICLGPRTVRASFFGERAGAHQPWCLAWARHAAPPGGSRRGCLRNSSALLCLSLRMAFPSAGKSSGAPLYILCLPKDSSVLSWQEAEQWRTRFRFHPHKMAKQNKTRKKILPPLFLINICIFTSSGPRDAPTLINHLWPSS